MIQPPFLQKNDTVAIVATARKIDLKEIEYAINLLKNWQLQIVIGKTIGLTENQFAGSESERVKDFQEALDNPNIKAIWCARGGYGTVKIIDAINFNKFKKNPKWIIGYSDITVIHNTVNNLGVASIHGIMPLGLEKNTATAKQKLFQSLFGELPLKYNLKKHPLNKIGKAEGEIIGGNLSILYSLLGSQTTLKTNNKILFIEDLDEYLYHIDRMMMNLKRNGYFDHLNGLIVGGMTDMHDNTIPFGKNANEIIFNLVEEYDFPVIFNFPAGHLDNNQSIIFGKTALMEVTSNNVTLIIN
ncbi:MAG: S66 peptidase family protein [Lutibacter sp.]